MNVVLSASTLTAKAGNPITFTISVAPANGGTIAPTGTITLNDGGHPIGTVTLSGGTATLVIANLKKGSHSITATYSGDVDFLTGASPAVDLSIT